MSDLLNHLKTELVELQSALAVRPVATLSYNEFAALRARERELKERIGQLEQDSAGNET
jgi:hypothetical protein